MAPKIHAEIKAIYAHWFIWFSLANQDIRLRYRRSILGPFWITISMSVTIYTIGFLYGNLFHIQLERYFPYLASGIISWAFISTTLTESSGVFIESESYIRNQESYVSLFVMRLIVRNMIVFFHNLMAYLPIIIFFQVGIGLKTFMIIPSLFVLGMNAFYFGTLLGIIGTRFRDFSQIVTSVIQVIFFLTPIMWMPSALSESNQWVIAYNPFNCFLNLIRCPLMQENIPLQSWWMVALITCINFFLYHTLIDRYKHRIVFWL